MKAAIIMGSTSDLSKVEPAIEILKDNGVEVKVRCLSAHRASKQLTQFVEEINEDGTEVIITAAGMAAALPGVVAAQTGLLAMNASIEAAHAGSLGKGFSIIAHEIRSLSEETTKNAEKISDII